MNICERLVVMSDTESIDLKDLPSDITLQVAAESTKKTVSWADDLTMQQALDKLEKEMLVNARKRCRNQRQMATTLGLDQSTVARKLKKHFLV